MSETDSLMPPTGKWRCDVRHSFVSRFRSHAVCAASSRSTALVEWRLDHATIRKNLLIGDLDLWQGIGVSRSLLLLTQPGVSLPRLTSTPPSTDRAKAATARLSYKLLLCLLVISWWPLTPVRVCSVYMGRTLATLHLTYSGFLIKWSLTRRYILVIFIGFIISGNEKKLWCGGIFNFLSRFI